MEDERQVRSRRARSGEQPIVCCSPAALGVDAETVAAQVKLLAALADPTRLQIVEMLARLDEPLCVCDIMPSFDLGQPTISHHLRVLREARLVSWEKRGLWVYYSLNRETLAQLTGYLGNLEAGTARVERRRTA